MSGPARRCSPAPRVAALALALVVAAAPAPALAQVGGGIDDLAVSDFGWLEGTWRGPGPGGAEASIHFMEPTAGVLPSVFRLGSDDRVMVLELITLAEREDGLHMYVRHFSTDLVPIEEDGAIDLRLIGREGDRYDFENVRRGNPTRSWLQRTGPEAFVSGSLLARPDGSTDTIRVEYRRDRATD